MNLMVYPRIGLERVLEGLVYIRILGLDFSRSGWAWERSGIAFIIEGEQVSDSDFLHSVEIENFWYRRPLRRPML